MDYFSKYYGISTDGQESWFDLRLDSDTPLYIDPLLVFRSQIPVFKDTREKFSAFFKSALELVYESQTNSNALTKLEESVLWFPEPMEIRLGVSEGKYGAGPGKKFSKACTQALTKLARRGGKKLKLDHFEKIEIFTSGIGPDGISDTAANILKQELIQYTQEVCRDLSVPMAPCAVEQALFDFEDKRWYHEKPNLPRNPYLDDKGIILVPKDFLCAIQAINHNGFSSFIIQRKSSQLRAELNYEIEKGLNRETIIEIAEKYPEWIDEYVEEADNDESIKPYDINKDAGNVYRPQRETFDFISEYVSKQKLPLSASNEDDFLKCIDSIIHQFRLCVEEQGGHKLLWNDSSRSPNNSNNSESIPRDEKIAQLLFSFVVSSYCRASNIELSAEVETGRGPVDFEFSSGYKNRVLLEMKLAKSSKLKQGLERQLPAYLKAKEIKYGYYLVVYFTDKEKKKAEKAVEEVFLSSGSLQGQVIMIDATFNKPSASNL